MTLKEIQIQVGGHVTSTIHSDHSTLLGGGFCAGRKEKTACGTQTAGCRGGWKGHDWFIIFLPLFLWDFTSSLASLFECGACLKCNLGTIYDISTGAQNKMHNYTRVVSGGRGCRSMTPQALFLHRLSVFLSTEKQTTGLSKKKNQWRKTKTIKTKGRNVLWLSFSYKICDRVSGGIGGIFVSFCLWFFFLLRDWFASMTMHFWLQILCFYSLALRGSLTCIYVTCWYSTAWHFQFMNL